MNFSKTVKVGLNSSRREPSISNGGLELVAALPVFPTIDFVVYVHWESNPDVILCPLTVSMHVISCDQTKMCKK